MKWNKPAIRVWNVPQRDTEETSNSEEVNESKENLTSCLFKPRPESSNRPKTLTFPSWKHFSNRCATQIQTVTNFIFTWNLALYLPSRGGGGWWWCWGGKSPRGPWQCLWIFRPSLRKFGLTSMTEWLWSLCQGRKSLYDDNAMCD